MTKVLTKAQKRRERRRKTQIKFKKIAENVEKGSFSEFEEEFEEGELKECAETGHGELKEEEVLVEEGAEYLEESGVIEERRTIWKDKESLPSDLVKYWFQRYSLFHRFDEGIRMDSVGWFSVTPEAIADHIAVKFAYQFNAASTSSTPWTICDAFCGVGGNAIAFAKQGFRVLAIDIDQTRLDCARHNAEIYNVAHLITFIHGDFMEITLLNKIEADAVFLSPPWGGIEYATQKVFDLQCMPIDGVELFEWSRKVSENICYFLPRHTNLLQLQNLAKGVSGVELEKVFLDNRFKCYNAYYGPNLGPSRS